MKTKFSAIKTYEQEDEVKQAMQRLRKDKKLYAMLFKLSFLKYNQMAKSQNLLTKIFAKFIKTLIKSIKFFFVFFAKLKLNKIQTTDEIQILVKKYLSILIKQSTSKISISGIENLQSLKQNPAIFISNHRDIVFDPALLNYALNEYGFSTTKIAIGDNLVKDPLVEDLMRLNKSFLVQRSIKGIKENLKAMQTLSEYIDYCLKTEKSSIWLAQRQGRAKDGIDKTDTGVLKMLCLANKKNLDLEANITGLNIIPVAISYEYDPCDFLKAQELETIKVNGAYQKEEDEDLKSIKLGLLGQKGEVSIHFCQPINQDQNAKANGAYTDIHKLAEYLDATIATNYKLYASNITAFNELNKLQNLSLDNSEKTTDSVFLARLEKYPANIRKQILEIYANPVIKKSLIQTENRKGNGA